MFAKGQRALYGEGHLTRTRVQVWVTTNLRQCLRGGGKGRNNRLHSPPFLGSPAGLPSGEPKGKPYGKGTMEEGGPHRSSGAQSRVEGLESRHREADRGDPAHLFPSVGISVLMSRYSWHLWCVFRCSAYDAV